MPLNGTKIHPLSDHARGVLQSLANGAPIPLQKINAGVWRRFKDEKLAEHVMQPSPYASHKGREIPHAKITEAGRKALTS